MSARELNGYGRCDGCGADFFACVGVYTCRYGCEEPVEEEIETIPETESSSIPTGDQSTENAERQPEVV